MTKYTIGEKGRGRRSKGEVGSNLIGESGGVSGFDKGTRYGSDHETDPTIVFEATWL